MDYLISCLLLRLCVSLKMKALSTKQKPCPQVGGFPIFGVFLFNQRLGKDGGGSHFTHWSNIDLEAQSKILSWQ
jgi:hypothetical protein